MIPADRAIRSILVAGGGITGLSAALAFAKALPRVRMAVLDLPPDPAALADRMPGTMASIHHFHRRIAIEEVDLVRAGAASHIIGQRIENWGGDWFHVHGDYGLPGTPGPFHLIWLRAWQDRKTLPFHDYSAPAALAAAGKFVHPDPNPASPLHAFDYGLRIDPELYRNYLSAHAERHRIARARGEIGGVERREDGGLAAILLKDGRRFEADLFVDAAGPSAPLRSTLDQHFESWSEALPCDRLLMKAWAGGDPSPTDIVSATPWGWRWLSPFPGGRVEGFVYSSAMSVEREARGAAGAEAELIALTPGRRPEPWRRNVLAIGDAAVAVDPLHWTNLHLAHKAIARALDLLPGSDCHPLALREYNRLTGIETERVRDYLALHYLASTRRFGPFWKASARRTKPEGLALTLRQWESRSSLPFFEEESFNRESWIAALLGMGVLPKRIDYRAMALDGGQCVAALERIAGEIATLPARLPSYPDYLRRMMGR